MEKSLPQIIKTKTITYNNYLYKYGNNSSTCFLESFGILA